MVKLVSQDFGVFRIGFLGGSLFRYAATDGFPEAVGIVVVVSYLSRNKFPFCHRDLMFDFTAKILISRPGKWVLRPFKASLPFIPGSHKSSNLLGYIRVCTASYTDGFDWRVFIEYVDARRAFPTESLAAFFAFLTEKSLFPWKALRSFEFD